MSDEIFRALDSFINQEKRLQEQLNQIKSGKDNIKKEIGKEVVTQLVRGYLGKSAGKLTRFGVNQTDKELYRQKEAEIDATHQSIVYNIKSFLSNISEFKKGISPPNSFKLVGQIENAQKGVKVETRIRATINSLSSIRYKELIYNSNIEQSKPTNLLVEAGTPFSASIEIRKILRSINGYVKIIDPYIDSKTLELLFEVSDNIPIQVLTEFTGGKDKEKRLIRTCSEFKGEKPLFELKKCKGIHDRFIISQNIGWSIGSSLKDFGKRLSSITSLAPEMRKEVESKFNQKWRKAIVLI